MGNKINYKKYENACPPGTYSTWEKRVYENECQMCPEGYNCDDYAITNITLRFCPQGHWCPEGTYEPRKCPPGTYFSERGAVQESDCVDCLAGHFCPEASAYPIECSPGHYCDPGASAQITCPGGYYCNNSTYFL